METTSAATDTISFVITLHVPRHRQAFTPANRPVAPVLQEIALRSWLHDYPVHPWQPKARVLTVAERNFYLQKGWGG
jgi:hypothetical protein